MGCAKLLASHLVRYRPGVARYAGAVILVFRDLPRDVARDVLNDHREPLQTLRIRRVIQATDADRGDGMSCVVQYRAADCGQAGMTLFVRETPSAFTRPFDILIELRAGADGLFGKAAQSLAVADMTFYFLD